MFEINGDEITITRGDSAIIDFTVDNHTFVEGDKVYFSVKKNVNADYEIHKEITTFENNIAKIILASEDTKLNKGKYWYDIQCSLVDGRVDTVIPKARFIVESEVTE